MKHANLKTIVVPSVLIWCCWMYNQQAPVSPQAAATEKSATAQEPQQVMSPEDVLRQVTPLYVRSRIFSQLIPFRCAIMGFIKNEGFFDTRNVYGKSEDQYFAFPQGELLDRCGRDINSKGHFNMLAIESRFRLEIQGPKVFNIPFFGAMEFDFWGFSQEVLGILRLRHAFMFFNWPEKNLLLGAYWHPILVLECYSNMVSNNAGSPIECVAREPQVRITKYFDNITLIFAAMSRVFSESYGPGTISLAQPELNSIYTRNGILPNVHIQAHATFDNQILGVGVDVTRFMPRLVTNKKYKTKESFFSWLGLVFTAIRWHNLLFKTKFIYAQNGSGYGLISGYGVHAIDPFTDQREYTNLQSLSGWIDLEYNSPIEPGIFIGYTKNIGSLRTIIPQTVSNNIVEPTIYAANATNIDYVFRVAPRIRWHNGPFVVGGEIDYMRAAFGKINNYGQIFDAKPVDNFRFLLATYYYF